jgi:AmmeMemoRadiSam system protein B
MSHWVEAPASHVIRRPAVAGSFYPGDADRLRAVVRHLYAVADGLPAVADVAGGPPLGLLVPHAGLVYSGATAASAWRVLRTLATPSPTVVLLGTNHGATWLEGVGAWDTGAWQTPLGAVPVDERLAAGIVGLGPPMMADLDAHELEHSIEVQLPLLQVVAPAARIVPLAVSCGTGPRALEVGERLGALLREQIDLGVHVVLAISTDLAHYPPRASCERTTELLAPAILALDGGRLAALESTVRGARLRGLSCGMCGIEPAVLGLAALRAMGATCGTRLASATSADAGGPEDRTVGYLSVRFDA